MSVNGNLLGGIGFVTLPRRLQAQGEPGEAHLGAQDDTVPPAAVDGHARRTRA